MPAWMRCSSHTSTITAVILKLYSTPSPLRPAGAQSLWRHPWSVATDGCPSVRGRRCRTFRSPRRALRRWLERSSDAPGCRGRWANAPRSPTWTARPRALTDSVLERAPAGGWLTLDELETLLTTHGIPYVPSRRCGDVDQAVTAARGVREPIVLKADFAAPAHASEIDAVLVGLNGESAVRAGWSELERRVIAAGREWGGAIVQRLEDPGADVLVGAFRDPDLGSVVAVGLGGRQAGLGNSIACRLPPKTDVEADELIDACVEVAAQLDHYPGGQPLDRDGLRELVLRFALLLESVPEAIEADLNSIRCTSDGCSVLDMRMRIERRAPPERVKTW